MEKMTDRARRAYLQWRTNTPGGDGISQVYAQSNSFLSPAFNNVHYSLCRYLEQLRYASPPPVLPSPSSSRSIQGQQIPPGFNAIFDTWLPDIYSFNSVGVGIDERYKQKFASAPPTPFMPSSPRVGEKEPFNFDHGALMTELEETSYMAWF